MIIHIKHIFEIHNIFVININIQAIKHFILWTDYEFSIFAFRDGIKISSLILFSFIVFSNNSWKKYICPSNRLIMIIAIFCSVVETLIMTSLIGKMRDYIMSQIYNVIIKRNSLTRNTKLTRSFIY